MARVIPVPPRDGRVRVPRRARRRSARVQVACCRRWRRAGRGRRHGCSGVSRCGVVVLCHPPTRKTPGACARSTGRAHARTHAHTDLEGAAPPLLLLSLSFYLLMHRQRTVAAESAPAQARCAACRRDPRRRVLRALRDAHTPSAIRAMQHRARRANHAREPDRRADESAREAARAAAAARAVRPAAARRWGQRRGAGWQKAHRLQFVLFLWWGA